MDAAISHLTEALRTLGSRRMVVVTGAGVSHASGIPTFRGADPDAVWSRDVTDMGTHWFFQMNPAESWSWYLARFDTLNTREPNPAHFALADIEGWHSRRDGHFTLVTQNVDPLHEKAGSEALIKVHGSADRVRCSRRGCENGAPSGSLLRADVDMQPFFDDPVKNNVPRCPVCGSLLRQHVLWFDEMYDEHVSYQWQRVLGAAAGADLLLFVGTSFAVGVTDLFLRAAGQRKVPAFSIDPGASDAPVPGVVLLRHRAEELLPAVVKSLDGC